MALPDGCLIDQAFNGKSAEEIYNSLPDCPPESGDDPGGCGEVGDFKGPEGKDPSPAEVAQEEQNWKISTVQAAQQAKEMGEMPGGLERLVGKMVKPKVNWREVLRRFIDQAAKNDYTWTRPNSRYLYSGLYLPALYSNELPPIVIAVDTSGSIDDDLIQQFATEMTAILQDHKTTCNVLYCDTRIQGVETFTSDDLPLDLNPKGGGGTDFRPPFKWVEKQGIVPACLIYLTDMCCYHFPEPPGYPVLWARTEDYGREAPFGEEVRIS